MEGAAEFRTLDVDIKEDGMRRRFGFGSCALAALLVVAAGCGQSMERSADDAAVGGDRPAPTTLSEVPAVPLSACQAAARWGALAWPGANDPAERDAWAQVEAEMVAVDDPQAVAAHRQMVDAWNRGVDEVLVAGAAEMERINGISERNQAEITRAGEAALAGDYDAVLDLPQEDYDVDVSGVFAAKAEAQAAIDAAVARFTALC